MFLSLIRMRVKRLQSSVLASEQELPVRIGPARKFFLDPWVSHLPRYFPPGSKCAGSSTISSILLRVVWAFNQFLQLTRARCADFECRWVRYIWLGLCAQSNERKVDAKVDKRWLVCRCRQICALNGQECGSRSGQSCYHEKPSMAIDHNPTTMIGMIRRHFQRFIDG